MTSNEDTPFDAIDEAFFRATHADCPVSEHPVSLELEFHEGESDQEPADPAESELVRARRARLTQTVVEIVATLALVSSTAFGMDFVRRSARAASQQRHCDSGTRGASPATSDSATQLRAAVSRNLPIVGERSAPGS